MVTDSRSITGAAKQMQLRHPVEAKLHLSRDETQGNYLLTDETQGKLQDICFPNDFLS